MSADNPTFEEINSQIEGTDPAAPQTAAHICPIYKKIRPILMALLNFALIPPKWKQVIKQFVQAMDTLCP